MEKNEKRIRKELQSGKEEKEKRARQRETEIDVFCVFRRGDIGQEGEFIGVMWRAQCTGRMEDGREGGSEGVFKFCVARGEGRV